MREEQDEVGRSAVSRILDLAKAQLEAGNGEVGVTVFTSPRLLTERERVRFAERVSDVMTREFGVAVSGIVLPRSGTRP